MQPAPLVSIILLAFNKERFTRLCLEALLRTEYPAVELWLVDNGSADGTAALFAAVAERAGAKPGWRVERVSFPENVGAVAGRNAALAQFRGRHVVFLDNDVVVEQADWLSRFVARLEAEPKLGAAGPKLVYPKPSHLLQCAGCAVTPRGRVDFVGRGEDARLPRYAVEREVQCLISACMIVRGEAARAAGLLDMAYHPVQFEDIDYCYRIRELGYRIVYFPEVTALHYENVTTGGSTGLNYRYLTVKNGLTFKRRWRHRYAQENGPADASIAWREIPRVAWEEVAG